MAKGSMKRMPGEEAGPAHRDHPQTDTERKDMDQASAPAPARDAQGLTEEDRRRRRSRSIALAVTLGLLVALFYVVTIAKLGPGVLDRPM
jgi:hypothetical protein